MYFNFKWNRLIASLIGHESEICKALWNYSGYLIATGSLDGTARIWDVRRLDKCLFNIQKHQSEILDIAFDTKGYRLATASKDRTARIWNIDSVLKSESTMKGHTDEISKVCHIWSFYISTYIYSSHFTRFPSIHLGTYC